MNSKNGTFMRVNRFGPSAWAAGVDSGGPVYCGNTALGVQSGVRRSYGHGIYMAIDFATAPSSHLGIRCVQKANKTC